MHKVHLILSFVLLLNFSNQAQVNYTAKDVVTPYDGHFRPACNLGNYTSFSAENLADLAAGNPEIGVRGVGVKALRPGMFDEFTTLAGFDNQIPVYQHFEELGLEEHTLIVGFPHESHQDTTHYCDIHQSQLFANMYAPIWDNGENGTPVNDTNYYAVYLWNLVDKYKDYVRFWEIWNEPGFDYTGGLGWLPPGVEGNWWDNNPDPCTYKLRAPIFHYIRLLRISWEIIKANDPDGYVVVSGTGFPAFLDAILRNTDNPDDGSVTADFPHKGGAYFDVMGYHAYPHFDGSMKKWNNEIQDWDFTRHSDGAAQGLLSTRDTFDLVLKDHGFNNITYPEKLWMITESNLPRKPFEDFIGSAEAQRNFMIKSVVTCMINEIWQFQVYKLAEDTNFDDAYMEFDLMGLYKNLDYNNLYHQEVNEEGIAYKTASDLLFEKIYDPDRTADLNLPENVGGGAFKDIHGNYTYCLWAKTETDMSEEASATISFPMNLGVTNLVKKEWNYGQYQNSETISSQNIELTGTPIFLTERIFSINNNIGCAAFQMQLEADDIANAELYFWTIEGGTPINSMLQNPILTLFEAGEYSITLQVFDTNDEMIAMQTEAVFVQDLPNVNYGVELTGPIARFQNLSDFDADSFSWDFGDGSFSDEPSPTHLYLESGIFEVILTATNECGEAVFTQEIEVFAPTTSQITETANDHVPTYEGVFRPSTNHEFYAGWTDEEMANIIAGNLEENIEGIGVKSLRASVGEAFFNGWGYDNKLPTYQHYSNLDLNGNSFILDFPSPDSRDPIYYCPTFQSNLFKDIYLDIWDDGENGTPINDENPFAVYVYETVKNYGEHIDFWEVLSSPDFDFTGDYGWLPPGEPGNWWENNPDPCDYSLRAPIFYYVRTLRISYEIIKNFDPDSYVTISGIAYPSFLDAILRNTDNPLNGSENSGYPEKGGAYFDAVGFKSYPHFDGSTIYFDLNIGTFAYERHSDAAVAGIPAVKNKFNAVLENYGYNGAIFPAKEWIISEANLPRKPFGDFMGSDLAQTNWIMKAWVECEKNDIRRLNIHRMAESHDFDDAADAFQIIGLYQKIEGTTPYNQVPNNEAIALKTTSKILFGTTYDHLKSAELNLPDTIGGGAFLDGDGNYIYVLWAKTEFDQSEGASAEYSFPASFSLDEVYKKDWYYSISNSIETISANDISLNGTPIFLTEIEQTTTAPIANFETVSNSICENETIQFTDHSINNPTEWLWTFEGGNPTTSTEQNPSVAYETPGIFEVSLEVSNSNGSHTKTLTEFIEIQGFPDAAFDIEIENNQIFITNNTAFADVLFWTYGDGGADGAIQPVHTYFQNGEYAVQLIAVNSCGADTLSQVVNIEAAPQANFNVFPMGNCEVHLFSFVDASQASPNNWNWTFPGGIPSSSNLQFPSVEFENAGYYDVTLVASNDFGSTEITQTIYVEGDITTIQNYEICEGDEFLGTVILNDTTWTENYFTQNLGCDSTVIFNIATTETLSSDVIINLCQGDIFNGILYENDTLLVHNYISNNGCDSIVFTDINIFENYEIDIIDTIEFGQIYVLADSVFEATGTYELNLESEDGCDSTLILDLTVLDDVGFDVMFQENLNLNIFPNPTSNEISIQFEIEHQSSINLEIININGLKVSEILNNENLSSGKHLFKKNINDLPAGIYFINLRSDGKSAFKKMVKL